MDQVQAKRFAQQLLHKTIGGWELIDTCNAGKSAVVLKGVKSGEIAAVKIFDPELIERFGEDRQSARIQRELSLRGKEHANLVKILDGGFCNQTKYWFVAMEFIDAPNLAEVIDVLPRGQIRKLISQVASAARFLEELQLAHRDIKPDNIAVYPDFEKAILLDLGVIRPFGLSEMTDEDQVTFVGTLQYSSPEFLLRDEIDTMDGWRAVTYYQLGAVLYDMIERKRIFSDCVNPYARLVRAIEQQMPVIDSKDVPPDLVLLARNCLHKDPELRLRFVAWKDFDAKEQGESAEDAKNRIRKRLGLVSRKDPTSTESERGERAQRRTIEEVRAKLVEVVREEFISSELFLPIEVQEFADDQPNKTGFIVFIKASERNALSYSVSLVFHNELLEVESKAVCLSFSAAISDERLTREVVLAGPRMPIFEGVFEESAILAIVESNIYPALDKAQQFDRNTAGLSGTSLEWLSLIEADKNE
ncbi:MAG: protein kinase [Pyrinomonadaceae bacterium]|nr:protein kinase [Pyrinomonadaceae bacterium]